MTSGSMDLRNQRGYWLFLQKLSFLFLFIFLTKGCLIFKGHQNKVLIPGHWTWLSYGFLPQTGLEPADGRFLL